MLDATGKQRDALLTLASTFAEVVADSDDTVRERLHANPIICTERVLTLACEESTPEEQAGLDAMLEGGYLVVSEEPRKAQAQAAAERPGYMNRAARRARRKRR